MRADSGKFSSGRRGQGVQVIIGPEEVVLYSNEVGLIAEALIRSCRPKIQLISFMSRMICQPGCRETNDFRYLMKDWWDFPKNWTEPHNEVLQK